MLIRFYYNLNLQAAFAGVTEVATFLTIKMSKAGKIKENFMEPINFSVFAIFAVKSNRTL